MSDYHLPVYESEALAAAGAAVEAIDAGGIAASALLKGCAQFRTLAICALLSRLDGDECCAWLCRGGQAFRAALARTPAALPATGRARPFLDAIAGGDMAGAALIAALLPASWRPEEEYEDEFLYQRFLAVHCFLGDRAEEERLMAALASADHVGDDGRLALCTAFHRHDAAGFASGVADLLAAHETRADELAASEAPEEVLCTEGAICIDALAVLRLGLRAGFTVDREYPFVPAVALSALAPPLPADAWRTAFA
jgi:hypothetical protein